MGDIKTKRHGGTGTRLYRIWKAMKCRCNNPKIPQAHNYSGRGIKICDEWNDNFVEFKKWALMNNYNEHLSIDRIDNNGNYEPSNCKWSTRIEQGNNTRNNIYLTYKGEEYTLSEWARRLGINSKTINFRYNRGYSVEQILGFKPLSFETKPFKKVLQLTLDGDVVREFPSIKSAEDSLGIYHVSECCTGKRKTSGGYKWQYKEGDSNY